MVVKRKIYLNVYDRQTANYLGYINANHTAAIVIFLDIVLLLIKRYDLRTDSKKVPAVAKYSCETKINW